MLISGIVTALLFFAYAKSRFSHDTALIIEEINETKMFVFFFLLFSPASDHLALVEKNTLF